MPISLWSAECGGFRGTVSVRYIVDRTLPAPGGWNRFSIEVADLVGTVDRLRAAGVQLRTDLITGVGGRQVVIDDPSGNPIELFEPSRTEARLTNR